MEEERKVSKEEGKNLADELGFPFVETSAKTGINVNETFEDLVERVDKIYGNMTQNKKNLSFQAKGRKCC